VYAYFVAFYFAVWRMSVSMTLLFCVSAICKRCSYSIVCCNK